MNYSSVTISTSENTKISFIQSTFAIFVIGINVWLGWSTLKSIYDEEKWHGESWHIKLFNLGILSKQILSAVKLTRLGHITYFYMTIDKGWITDLSVLLTLLFLADNGSGATWEKTKKYINARFPPRSPKFLITLPEVWCCICLGVVVSANIWRSLSAEQHPHQMSVHCYKWKTIQFFF